jgi:hypothetical protein
MVNEYRNNRITVDFVSKDGRRTTSWPRSAMACTVQTSRHPWPTKPTTTPSRKRSAVASVPGAAHRLRGRRRPRGRPPAHQIEPIFDADSSVFFDLNAKRQDKSDAKFCFVSLDDQQAS